MKLTENWNWRLNLIYFVGIYSITRCFCSLFFCCFAVLSFLILDVAHSTEAEWMNELPTDGDNETNECAFNCDSVSVVTACGEYCSAILKEFTIQKEARLTSTVFAVSTILHKPQSLRHITLNINVTCSDVSPFLPLEFLSKNVFNSSRFRSRVVR